MRISRSVWPLGNRWEQAMKRSRFSEQQIAFIPHPAGARKAGASLQT
jgi:hypothetical protein